MREIDDTDLALYLRVLAQAAKHRKKDKEEAPTGRKGKGEVIELKRGYIDDFWG